jgi:glucose-6-phosphate-specific signal transduction histidine kinase
MFMIKALGYIAMWGLSLFLSVEGYDIFIILTASIMIGLIVWHVKKHKAVWTLKRPHSSP